MAASAAVLARYDDPDDVAERMPVAAGSTRSTRVKFTNQVSVFPLLADRPGCRGRESDRRSVLVPVITSGGGSSWWAVVAKAALVVPVTAFEGIHETAVALDSERAGLAVTPRRTPAPCRG